MSISSINSMSYSSMTSGTVSIKGQSSSSSQEDSTAKTSSTATDSVSLSTYSIDGQTVTKSEFEKYDTDGDGSISASELSAYKKAQADLEAAKAEMEKAFINLEYTSIKAPISGKIGRSSVTTGALVTANQSAALATIQKLDQVYVDVTQTSASLLKLKRNTESGMIKKDSANQAKVRLVLEDGTPYPQE